MRHAQRGLAAVEFAVVAMLALVTLFAVIEIGRVFFVMNALEEATRRGARVAAVCQVNDAAIRNVAAFADGGGDSTIVSGLSTANFVVQYLDQAGNGLADPLATYGAIRYVRVSIANFTHQLMIPLFVSTLTLPAFATTLPAESLGVWPGGYSPC